MSEEKDEFGIPFIGADGACDHLRHAMMAESTGRRVCQSCQIKVLESRLKEFQAAAYDRGIECNELYNKCHDLESRLKEAEKALENDIEGYVALEQRLSQAEAEKDDFNDLMYDIYDAFMKVGIDPAGKKVTDCIAELNQRLSHLMDVAGKMAWAMQKIYEVPESVDFEEDPCGQVNEMRERAKLALAEWDGIKK